MAFANPPDESELVQDDDILLQDRLLRSFHRDKHGHLATHRSHKIHEASPQQNHNVIILSCYLCDDGEYSLFNHYVYSSEPLNYREWCKVAETEAVRLTRKARNARQKNFYGVYGWQTNFVKITPLRTGDLWLKIDEKGPRCVRLAFSPRENSNEAHPKTK
jgi:hypothetical protein